MGERFVHQGARSSGNTTYARTARCIYSGNTKIYSIEDKEWNANKQWSLDSRFMKNECQCNSCLIRREDDLKTIKALQRDNDINTLAKLGVV